MGDIADMLFDQGFDDWMDGDRYDDYPLDVKHKKYHGLKPGAPCPACGNMLVLRTNGKTGAKFVGCSNFRYCHVTSGYHRLEAGGNVIANKTIEIKVEVKPCFNCRDCQFHRVYEIGDDFLPMDEHYCILFNANIDKGPFEECLSSTPILSA